MKSKKKQKYYVVWVGRMPGIYTTWEDCKAQTDKYPSARYRSFYSIAEAAQALENPPAARKKQIDHREGFVPIPELTLADYAYNLGMRDQRTKHRG